MPNKGNIERPVVFVGLGRSGTSAMTEMLGEYPDIETVGEVSPVLWDLHEDVRAAYMNMRYPSAPEGKLTRDGFPAQNVRDFFLRNFHSEKKVWVIKPIGLLGKVKERFINRGSDASFITWYFDTLRACFSGARVYALVRDPIEYAKSARRYWRAPVSDIVTDVEFMAALLRSGEINAEDVIRFDDFTGEQDVFLERIVREAGIENASYRGIYREKRFASSQGKAMADSVNGTEDVSLSQADIQRIWSVIGDEYAPFLKSERPGAVPDDPMPDDDQRDYRAEYLALCEEFEFLKAKADGLEQLANTKEDVIQDLIKWSRMLEEKSERFAKALLDNGILIPPKPE